MNGKKYDSDKPMWCLLPLKQIEQIVHVLTFGARKYGIDNWKKVDDPVNRYYSALMRHLYSWRSNEWIDKESGLPHLAHAGCCLLFLMWFGMKNTRNNKNIVYNTKYEG